MSPPLQILITAAEIQARVGELARRIAADYRSDPVTLIGILTGSLMFMADLVRQLDLRSRLGFIQASSYRGDARSPQKLEVIPHMLPDIAGRHVLLVDDILDSGQTLAYLMGHLRSLAPRSLRSAVLLRKRGRQQVALEPDYSGFDIPNEFVVGYGMDFNDDYRQLPYVAVLPATEEAHG